tara:strand:- start:653 stop:2743 length:2091 start_codon:yes stop_codon:yes gene_type:complete
MNIKKIIKEGMDDFDWIREIPAHKLHYACDVINHIEEGDVVYLTGYAYYIDDFEDPNDPNHIEVRFDNDKGIVIKKFSIDGGVTYDYFDVKMDEKFFDNPEDTDEVSFHCEEHMEGWDDPNKNIKLRLEKPLKESNDFDWAKETNPIQYKDLKGYHFFYGSNPKKYIIDDVIGDDLIYIWWDAHNDEYDKNTMNCDTFIHRVKLGNYKLFDNDDKEVDPRDLVYIDNTFDDDERKEIWEQDEFKWIEETPVVTIGGKNGYPKESVPLGTKVISRVGEVFTIEDITGGHMDFQHVWGSDLERAWIGPEEYDDNKNWHNALWLRRATPEDLNESEDDFDWVKDVEAKLVKGMFLCNRHGNNWEIAGIDERNWGRKIIRFYNDPFNKKVTTRRYEEIIEDLEDGRLTICKPRKSVTESDDFDWAKDTKPSRKDKLDFSKERYKTTKNYDGVNIGDKFRPPGSHNIWTVVDKVLHQTRWVSDVYWKKQPKGDLIEIETYWVYIEDENGKTTQKVWDKVKNGKGKKFPGSYKPWEKVIESVNESKKIDRYSITGDQWSDMGKDPNGPFVLWKDAGKPKNVTRITPTGYGRMRDAKKGEWIRYGDVYEDEWEWARTTQPIELENPKDWVGRSFGYGQEIIDDMSDGEINASYDEEYFTITGIDENGNLTLIKNHPIYGENHDSTTSPRNLRDYISKGSWVWI